MLNVMDGALNRITMYRLTLWSLASISAIAAILGAAGIMPFGFTSIVYSALAFILACAAANAVFASFIRQ